ncbi:MAG: hypothetical protein EOR06_29625 [Mesorhizobium sp.]|nr:hypothetical protein EJ075_22110 [Mesorhizobium sp. M6A.T.Cr.TU.016.01.1.1]RWP46811.1 MAG: hypothetical protein EOR06_29625 [Mesorhizobium sp.]
MSTAEGQPPSVLPDISPARGRLDVVTAFANLRRCRVCGRIKAADLPPVWTGDIANKCARTSRTVSHLIVGLR